jgi:hypothetical protein
MASFATERPDDLLASDANLNTIWAASHNAEGSTLTQLAFEYDSGVEVQLQPWASNGDPAKVFAQLAAEFDLKGGLTTIGKDPAIVVTLNEASPAG